MSIRSNPPPIDKISDRQGRTAEAFEIVRRSFRRIINEIDSLSGAPGSGSTLAPHDLLSSTHSDTVTQSVSRGSLVYGNGTPKWDELAVGATGTFLGADGTDVSWRLVLAGYPTFGITLSGQAYSP